MEKAYSDLLAVSTVQDVWHPAILCELVTGIDILWRTRSASQIRDRNLREALIDKLRAECTPVIHNAVTVRVVAECVGIRESLTLSQHSRTRKVSCNRIRNSAKEATLKGC